MDQEQKKVEKEILDAVEEEIKKDNMFLEDVNPPAEKDLPQAINDRISDTILPLKESSEEKQKSSFEPKNTQQSFSQVQQPGASKKNKKKSKNKAINGPTPALAQNL